MDILECFGDIIGLDQDSSSDSGLYITDLEAISTIAGLTIEQGKEVEEIMEDARRVAILALNADLTALMMKYSSVRKPFIGKIGSDRWTSTAKGGAELVLLCRPLRNASMHLHTMGAIFQEAGIHEIHMVSNIGHDETFSVNCTAKKLSVVAVNQTLPLYSDMVDIVEYRFSHEQDYCVAKLVSCGSCSFKFKYSFPRFRNLGLGQYLNVAGYKNECYVNSSSGMILGVDIRCRIDNLICDEEMDFTHNPLAQMYAQAIQYKAGSVVVWNCLRNTNLNRVLMENSDDLRDAAKYYERRYRDMMAFINKHRPYDHDCICEKRNGWIGLNR